MESVLIFIAGSLTTLLVTLIKTRIDRESACSNEIYKQRLLFLNKIWCSFYEVKKVYASKVTLGHNKWLIKYETEALHKLNLFRKNVDESQMVLNKEIISEFRKMDGYLFSLLSIESQKPSEFVNELNVFLEIISKAINLHMNKRLQTINLYLTT